MKKQNKVIHFQRQDAKSVPLSASNKVKTQIFGGESKSCPLFCVVFRICSRPLLAKLGAPIANMNSKFAKEIMPSVKNKKFLHFHLVGPTLYHGFIILPSRVPSCSRIECI